MKYLVETKDGNKELFSTVDIDDLLLFTAKYFGYDKPVLRLGLKGCKTIEEKVEMYNALIFPYFDDDCIKRIFEVGERIYG